MEEWLLGNPAAFVVVFPLFWVFVLSLLSILSGWRQLAQDYSASSELLGDVRRMQSLSMGYTPFFPVNFSGVISLRANGDGVGFSVFFLFRPFHEALFIPYSEINWRPRKVLFFKGISISTQKAPSIFIMIDRRMAQWIDERSQGRWRERASEESYQDETTLY